jgi:5-formyltetrahydrofolate cyclo-ligase
MMSTYRSAEPVQQKQEIRRQAQVNRAELPNKDEVSRQIMANALALPEYAASHTVMYYVDVRNEVRTRFDLREELRTAKRIIVPYCEGDRLALFDLHDMDELAVGRFGVLEPRPELRTNNQRRAAAEEVELVFVPGVAFDRHGGRMGHGNGYYDKLLADMLVSTVLIGLAFECQVFPRIAMESHDVSMDRVVTESAVYVGRGR